MNGSKNQALSRLLDGTETAVHSIDRENGELDEQAAKAVYKEHLARLKAEAEAEETSKRLAVAQTQLAEYSMQKSDDVEQLEQQAVVLEELFNELKGSWSDSSLVDKLSAQMNTLVAKIEEISGEAKAFALQQKEDLQKSQGIITQISALPKDRSDSDPLEELSTDMDTDQVSRISIFVKIRLNIGEGD